MIIGILNKIQCGYSAYALYPDLARTAYMRQILPTLLLILILTGCNIDRTTTTESKLDIKEPKLLDIKSSNSEFSHAIHIIQKHLIKLNVPIDSMYFLGVDSTSEEEWKFHLIHYNNYLVQAESEVEQKRIDSLEKAGVTEYYLKFVPPSGNWGGYDRTIIYSRRELQITDDLIVQ